MDMIVKTSVSVKSSKTELCLSFEEDPTMENVATGDGIVERTTRTFLVTHILNTKQGHEMNV